MVDVIDIIRKIIGHRFYVSGPSSSVSGDSKYRPDIDGLRAIAVCAVVLFHAFPTYLTGGFVGVDVFFVISGYLISSIIYKALEAGSFSFARFYGRRIRRIFPSLIVLLIACYAAGWYVLLSVEYKKLGAHIAAGAGFVSNLLLYGESGYFDSISDNKPLLHLWSLAIEEQFYLVWPVFLFVLWKIKLNILTASIGLTLLSFILNVITVKTDSIQAFYWPTSRIWELLIGACLAITLAHVGERFQRFKNRADSLLIVLIYRETPLSYDTISCNVVSIAGALLVVLPMYFLTKATVFPGWWAVAPTFGTALLISAGQTAWINQRFLSSRLLIGIGLISYPLYLWHWPLLVFTRIVVGHQTSTNTRIAIIILSIILAWLTYIFIDRPFRFGSFPQAKIILLCVSMVVAGFVGYHTYRQDGLSFRFPTIIQNITSYKERDLTRYRIGTCFLYQEQDESKFGTCVDNAEKPASTAVILWGDSFAAHLYPGIVADKPDVRITQLSSGGCPPIVKVQISAALNCRRINDYVLKRISHEKPNTVMLAGRWVIYDWKQLTKTILRLKNASIHSIYLIGSPPEWTNSLPTSLYNYFTRDALHRMPNRMHFGLTPNMDTLDKVMQEFATEARINYISTYKILCTSDGCLTRTGESVDTLVTLDYGHLTTIGSKFVVSRFPRTLLHSR